MIEDFMKLLFLIISIMGWLFFFLTIVIVIRWTRFVNRNPNAQEIINQIFLRVIFLD